MTQIKPVRVVEARQTYITHLLAVALLWALAMTFDYRDQAAVAEARAERIDAEFTDCLKGKWREVTEQGVELGCMPVEQNIKLTRR